MNANRLVAAGLGIGLALPGAAGCSSEVSPRPDHSPSASPVFSPSRPDLVGFAIGDGFFGLPDAELNGRLDTVAKHGNSLRLDFDWAQAQPTENGPYDWDESDRIVSAARARGLVVLAMVGFAPPWARDTACSTDYGCAPRDASAFATFAGAVADRYKNDVADFEIWNEPNVERFFGPRPNAERYARMLTLAAAAIKTANPDARVASAGLAAGYDDGTNISPVTFLKTMYDAGAKGFDAVAVHPYNSPALPSQPFEWSAFTQIEGDPSMSSVPTIHGVMATNGDAQKPIWLTEYGAPTGGAGNRATVQDQRFDDFDEKPGAHVDEGLQAAMIGDFLRYEFGSANVTVRMVHTLYDRRAPGESTDSEDYFGIYNADGTPKKAATVFVRR